MLCRGCRVVVHEAHGDDSAVSFTARAWRRPLTMQELLCKYGVDAGVKVALFCLLGRQHFKALLFARESPWPICCVREIAWPIQCRQTADIRNKRKNTQSRKRERKLGHRGQRKYGVSRDEKYPQQKREGEKEKNEKRRNEKRNDKRNEQREQDKNTIGLRAPPRS